MVNFWILNWAVNYHIRSRNFLPFMITWVHPRLFSEVRVAHRLLCCPIMCLFTFWISCCNVSYNFRIKRCSVRLYLQLFIGGLVSYLRYLYLFAVVTHIVLCFLLCLSSCVLCTQCCQFLWIVHFWFPHRYSLTFIECIS